MNNVLDQFDENYVVPAPDYNSLQPHLKKLWNICVTLLDLGIKPTPSLINQALGKPKRASLNGPQCQVKNYLLQKYGYEYMTRSGSWGRAYSRWVKKESE